MNQELRRLAFVIKRFGLKGTHVSLEAVTMHPFGYLLLGPQLHALINEEFGSADAVAVADPGGQHLLGPVLSAGAHRQVAPFFGISVPVLGKGQVSTSAEVAGDDVVILDGVVGTGERLLKVREGCIEAGFKVVGAVGVVDRRAGARAALRGKCKYVSLLTYGQVERAKLSAPT